MQERKFPNVSKLIEEVLSLLEKEEAGIEEVSHKIGFKENETLEVLGILEEMGLVRNYARPSDFGSRTLKVAV